MEVEMIPGSGADSFEELSFNGDYPIKDNIQDLTLPDFETQRATDIEHCRFLPIPLPGTIHPAVLRHLH